jgi:hypothetical protein
MVNRLKLAAVFAQANEQKRGSGPRVEVVLDRGPNLVGHFDDALTVVFAEYPPAL